MLIQQFRTAGYQSILKRTDAILDLVDTCLGDSPVDNLQVQEPDLRLPKQKVIVADSLSGNHVFLAFFLGIKHTLALVRLHSNLVLYEHIRKGHGAPAKHGPCFKLSQPSRPADRSETFQLGAQTVQLQAWQGLPFKKLPTLVGMG